MKFDLLQIDRLEIIAIVTAYELDQTGPGGRFRAYRSHRPARD